MFQAGKTKGAADLLLWIPAIRNHLWHCAEICNGDTRLLKVQKCDRIYRLYLAPYVNDSYKVCHYTLVWAFIGDLGTNL